MALSRTLLRSPNLKLSTSMAPSVPVAHSLYLSQSPRMVLSFVMLQSSPVGLSVTIVHTAFMVHSQRIDSLHGPETLVEYSSLTSSALSSHLVHSQSVMLSYWVVRSYHRFLSSNVTHSSSVGLSLKLTHSAFFDTLIPNDSHILFGARKSSDLLNTIESLKAYGSLPFFGARKQCGSLIAIGAPASSGSLSLFEALTRSGSLLTVATLNRALQVPIQTLSGLPIFFHFVLIAFLVRISSPQHMDSRHSAGFASWILQRF